MVILGIETSCDDTALALIETRGSGPQLEIKILGSLIHSQAELHNSYGGVFPTLAKREHGKNILPLLHQLFNSYKESKGEVESNHFSKTIEKWTDELKDSNPDLSQSLADSAFLKSIPQIDHIAVTEGPGLVPSLWVGINFAHILSEIWDIPVDPINHMEGHIVGSLVDAEKPLGEWQTIKNLPLPSLALLVSGGHTEFVKINQIGNYEVVGKTKDDAVGEAFDKVARLIELPYPGGPEISRLAKQAKKENIKSPISLPRPMLKSGDIDLSFSGLKTAVLYAVRKNLPLSDEFKKGLAREFEEAIVETLDTKLRMAIEKVGNDSIVLGGGVIANTSLREKIESTAQEYQIPLFLPSKNITGDNALMIAIASALRPVSNSRKLRAEGTKSLNS